MYYGQWETDKIIEEYFPNKNKGVCIEVGAYDGIKGSNTKFFEEKGWTALCIEPNPNISKQLIKNRLGPCEICACDNYYGLADLTIFNFKSGVQSSLTSLNTDKRLISDYSQAIDSTSKIKNIPVLPLHSLILKHKLHNIDFISIDTEGTELNVLQGLRLDKNQPHLLVVENNYQDAIIIDYICQFGYIYDKRYYVNDFYIKEKYRYNTGEKK